MSGYLKTDEDKLSYLRVLFHMMHADWKTDKNEMEYIYSMLYVHHISESLFYEAKDLYEEYGIKDSVFSGYEPAIQAVVDAAELMVCDLKMDIREIARLIDMAAKLGVVSDKGAYDLVRDYAKTRLEAGKKLDSMLNKVADDFPDFSDYSEYLPTKNDRLSFIRLIVYVAASDKIINEEEMQAIQILAKLYGINSETVVMACEQYKDNPKELPEFEHKYSFFATFKEAVKICSRDNNLAEEEKEAVKNLVKEYKVSWGEGYISIVLDAVENLIKCAELKNKCINDWINNCKY